MKLNIILCALLLTISLQAMVVIRAYRSGQESTRYEALEKAVKESNTTVRELLKATAETQSALAAIRREDQERAARGEERRETMRKNLQADECALLPLLMLLTACNNTPAPLKTGVICGSVPESLTRQTPVPVLPQHMIWADVADWGDRLVDALDSCNADKAAIAGLERQRTARMNTHEK
ncbi:hypothetical protein ACO4HV_004973 [Escherichia coli]